MAEGNGKKGTPALGIDVLDQTCNAGRAEPVAIPDRAGEAVAEVAHRAAQAAVSAMLDAQHATPRAPDNRGRIEGWIKWAIGMLVILLGAWWGLSEAFSARPTRPVVEELIEKAEPAQHKDMRDDIEENHEAINAQAVQFSAIKNELSNINKVMGEIKREIKR